MIKSFRGILADGAEERITLHTNDGKTGYRIVKFQIIVPEPGEVHMEHTVKIYKVSQANVNNAIDFSDNALLGVAYIVGNANEYSVSNVIIFDNEVFNQDVYVTHENTSASNACNYYIELEQVSLDLNGSTVATLQSLRTSDSSASIV